MEGSDDKVLSEPSEDLVLVNEILDGNGVCKACKKSMEKIHLTPEREKIILDAIRAGAFIETAVGLAGLSKRTFYEWLRQGRNNNTQEYAEFARKVNRALHECTVADLATIGIAAQRDWKAAAWRLSHRYPKWYSDSRQSLEVKGNVSLNTAGIFAELERRADARLALAAAAEASGEAVSEGEQLTSEEKKKLTNKKKIDGFNSRVLIKSEGDDELPEDVLADMSGLGENSLVTDIPDVEIK